MTYAEHALENAIIAMKNHKEMNDWAAKDLNLPALKASAEEVWAMAGYVVYTYKNGWEDW